MEGPASRITPIWDVTERMGSPQSSGFEEAKPEEEKGSNEGQRMQFSLPEDLLIPILALLPLPKLLQLRLVCRSWHRLLRSPEFRKVWASHQHCWLVMASSAIEFVAYCVTEAGGRKRGEWMSLSPLLESLQLSAHFGWDMSPQEFGCEANGHCVFPVAGAQRHLCVVVVPLMKGAPHPIVDFLSLGFHMRESIEVEFWREEFDRREPTLVVVNVLTGATEILPFPPVGWSLRMLFLVNTSNTGYFVVVHDVIVNSIYSMEVYSSDSGSWRTVRSDHGPGDHAPDVQNGDIFWPAFKSMKQRGFNGVLAYNVQEDAWSKVLVDFPADALGYRSQLITKHKGCLFLVDVVGSPESRHTRQEMHGVGVWVLQQLSGSSGAASWVEVARSPWQDGEVFRHAELDYAPFVEFLSFGGLICMTGKTFRNPSNYMPDFLTPIVYDLDLNSWYSLPVHRGSMSVSGVFAFQPTFLSDLLSLQQVFSSGLRGQPLLSPPC